MHESALGRHVVRGYGAHLALSEHLHRLHAGQGPPRRHEPLEPEHRARSALDPAVVLLDAVVQPAPAPVPGEAPELARPLQLAERAGVALKPVGHDGPRVTGVPAGQRPAEEAARGGPFFHQPKQTFGSVTASPTGQPGPASCSPSGPTPSFAYGPTMLG